MALISERMESCGKKVLDSAGVVREAISRQLRDSFRLPTITATHQINKSLLLKL